MSIVNIASEESMSSSETRNERSGGISEDNPTSETESVFMESSDSQRPKNTAQMFGTTLLRMRPKRRCCVNYATMNILTLEQRVTLEKIV